MRYSPLCKTLFIIILPSIGSPAHLLRHYSVLGCDWLQGVIQALQIVYGCERNTTRTARCVCVRAERFYRAELNRAEPRQQQQSRLGAEQEEEVAVSSREAKKTKQTNKRPSL